MRTLSILLVAVLLQGCSDPAVTPAVDAGADLEPPRNQDNTDGGLCCQITNNFQDEPFWNNGFYYCVTPGMPADPFNPPFLCNVTFDGFCGDDTGLDCLTCFDPRCVVGMRCRDVNGTGTVLPCR